MNAKPLDLAAMQAICDAASETVRLEAIASGQMLPVWDDLRGVVDIDPNSVGPFVGGMAGASDEQHPPILNMQDPTVIKMIALATNRGFITYLEINALMPAVEVTSEQIEDVMALFSQLGVDVIEDEPVQLADVVGDFYQKRRTGFAAGRVRAEELQGVTRMRAR